VCDAEGCGKRFARQDGLNTHSKIHLDVKPFVCQVDGCDKAYYHIRSLRKHARVHGGYVVEDEEEAATMLTEFSMPAGPINQNLHIQPNIQYALQPDWNPLTNPSTYQAGSGMGGY
jgi:hypothetical protein